MLQVTPQEIDDRVEEFLSQFGSKLLLMTAEEIQKFVDAVVLKYREKPKNLMQEASRYADNIASKLYQFSKRELIASETEKLRKDDILKFWNNYIDVRGASRRKLSTHVYSQKYGEESLWMMPEESRKESKPTVGVLHSMDAVGLKAALTIAGCGRSLFVLNKDDHDDFTTQHNLYPSTRRLACSATSVVSKL